MELLSRPIVIAGAGPAGCSAAIVLARAGLQVQLVDRARFPRPKTCGDGFTYKCYPHLQRLGVLDTFWQNVQWKASGYRMVFSDGSEVHYRKHNQQMPPLVCMMTRFKFDALLLEKALAFPSVSFLPATRIIDVQPHPHGGLQVIAEKETRKIHLHTPLLIDACGATSPLAKKLALPTDATRDSALALRGYFENVQGLQNEVEFYFTRPLLPGYVWVFPLSAHSANVGCGSLQRVVEKQGLDLRTLLHQTLQEHPLLKERFAQARLCEPLRGGKIPLALSPRRKRSSHHYLQIGDAAGLADPITAEGISYALQSGILAAEVARAAWVAKDFSASFLQQYDQRCQEQFARYFEQRHFLTESTSPQQLEKFLLEQFHRNLPLPSPSTPEVQYELAFRLKSLMKMLR